MLSTMAPSHTPRHRWALEGHEKQSKVTWTGDSLSTPPWRNASVFPLGPTVSDVSTCSLSGSHCF